MNQKKEYCKQHRPILYLNYIPGIVHLYIHGIEDGYVYLSVDELIVTYHKLKLGDGEYFKLRGGKYFKLGTKRFYLADFYKWG